MPSSDEAPRGSAGRGRAAGTLLLAAAFTGLCALPTWLTTTTESVLGVPETIRVSGGTVAPTIVAAALVLLAATGALALVGKAGRWFVVATVALAGVLVVAGSVGVLRDPAAAVAPTVAERIGVERVVVGVDVGAWPWIAVAAGVLDALVAVWIARVSQAWVVAGGRDRHVRAEAVGGPGVAAGTAPQADEPVDERDQWDALSRGDDPSEGDADEVDGASGAR